jgi:hypothetical protein
MEKRKKKKNFGKKIFWKATTSKTKIWEITLTWIICVYAASLRGSWN